MRLTNLLYSAFLAPIIPLERELTATCPSPHNMFKMILYESYIPLDALAFKIGTKRMGKGEVEGIITKVLEMKKQILRDPNNAAKVFNLSDVINEKNPVRNLLLKRYSLIKSDDSFIFKELIREKQEELLRCIKTLEGRAIRDPLADDSYRQMVYRIYETIYENLDVQEAINREKGEFYRIFIRGIPDKEYQRTRVVLSLGGSIFYLPQLIRLVGRINLKDKNKFVREWVNNVFSHIEKLSIAIASKHFIEQKYLVKEFIRNSTETGPGNNAFESRMAIVKAANMNSEEIGELSMRQSVENEKLMRIVDNITEGHWIIRYNRDIKEDMITYLLTQQPEDKRRLLAHFK